MEEGKFIMMDGIDGSGKSTVMQFWAEALEQQGKNVFSLKTFWIQHGRHPKIEEIPADTFALISGEPTDVWVGAAIRQEMIQNGTGYSPHAIATAFALDRLVLYTRVILPARARGIHVLQDRGVSTSLCYQSVSHDGALSAEEIAQLEGNAFALEHAPDVLLLMDIAPERCMERLAGRSEKDDNAIFEKSDMLQKLHACYHGEEFQSQFSSRGTTIMTFNADQDMDSAKLHSQQVLTALLAQ